MFNLIIILFFVFVAILILIPTIILSVIGRIMSLFNRHSPHRQSENKQQTYNRDRHTDWKFTPRKEKRGNEKIFDKNDGEYVSFEEVENEN